MSGDAGSGRSESGKSTTTGHDQLAAGITAYQNRQNPEAIQHFSECVQIAAERNDQPLQDRAFCNLVSVQLEMELAVDNDALRELRQVLMRSTDPNTACLAAYNIARIYELAKKIQRALFYANLAFEHSQKPDAASWEAACLNLLGNLELADSQWEQACSRFERALRYSPAVPALQRAFITDNLGYCRFVQRRFDEGFELVFESLRTFIREGARDFELYPRLSLCYGYLEVKKYRPALRHGTRALETALRIGDETAHKNALFLVGESFNLMGDQERAWETFETLQQRYFPESPHIPTLLMSLDVRSLVNLKA